MNKVTNCLLDATSVKRHATNLVKRLRLVLPIAIIGLMIHVSAHAEDHGINTFTLTPPAALANCLPDATARVTVFSKEDVIGVDTFDLVAQGLPPNTEFTVFLCEQPNPPFGAAQYIGDFTTNRSGKGFLRVDTIVNEAFASTLVGNQRVRKELNHVVIWFADPEDDDFCFGAGGGVTTPFDGDGVAGATVLSSANALPGAPLP
jgi:hypothetical protein